MSKRMVIAVLFLLAGLTFPSVLGNMAAGLAEKSFIKMPANPSLDTVTLPWSLTYWTNSGVWDPVRKKVYWMGGPGTCCADPAWYKRFVYDDATNTWTVQSTPFSGSGHGYDANAVNPVNGDHYFALLEDARVKRYNGTGFSLLPPLTVAGTTPSLTWVPQLNNGAGGLLYMGDNGFLARYTGSAWVTVAGLGALSGYDNFSEYNPVHKVVWLGSGTSTPRVHYRLDSNLTLTRLQDAPFSLEGNACALHSCDPVTGLYIVTNLANQTWWEFDVMADAWTQITGMTAKPDIGTSCNGNGNNQWQVPIPEYGVIMYFEHGTSAPSVYLYKHRNRTVVENRPVKNRKPAELSAAPSPARAGGRIAVSGALPGAEIRVFDAAGRRVATLHADRDGLCAWTARGARPGVYMARMVGKEGRSSVRFLILN